MMPPAGEAVKKDKCCATKHPHFADEKPLDRLRSRTQF